MHRTPVRSHPYRAAPPPWLGWPQVSGILSNVTALVNSSVQEVEDLLHYGSYEFVNPLYRQVKSVFCCTTGNLAYNQWWALMAAGEGREAAGGHARGGTGRRAGSTGNPGRLWLAACTLQGSVSVGGRVRDCG